jgi:hypothetical protein
MFVLDALSALFTVDVERGQNLYQSTNAFSTNGFEIYGVKKLHEWLRRRIYISPSRAWGPLDFSQCRVKCAPLIGKNSNKLVDIGRFGKVVIEARFFKSLVIGHGAIPGKGDQPGHATLRNCS